MERAGNSEQGSSKEIEEEHMETSEQNPKKIKLDPGDEQEDLAAIMQAKPERCEDCQQYIEHVIYYKGHPNNASEEFLTLIDKRLLILRGAESVSDAFEERPCHKITNYTVYDARGHVCPFDTGLIEAGKELRFSGYVKRIDDENLCITDGIPTKDMGPIIDWFITGFDHKEKALVGFGTEYAEYYLQEPSQEYREIMGPISKKIDWTKMVIEFLIKELFNSPTYENLLQWLTATENLKFSEEALFGHMYFICEQVSSFDSHGTSTDNLLMETPCMQFFVQMSGFVYRKVNRTPRRNNRNVRKRTTPTSRVTTTTLVQQMFENFFQNQIRNETNENVSWRKRCGVCESCQRRDCGRCTPCRDMLKFGGTGQSKKDCGMRRCPYIAIQGMDEESDGEDEPPETVEDNSNSLQLSIPIVHEVTWIGSPLVTHRERIYYSQAEVDGHLIEAEDNVMVRSADSSKPLLIARVNYMWQDQDGISKFHAHLFCRGTDTVLGETSDPREIFMQDVCTNIPLGGIVRKAEVNFIVAPDKWKLNGGQDQLPPQVADNGRSYYYSKWYFKAQSRFEEVPEVSSDSQQNYTPCEACSCRDRRIKKETPRFQDGNVYWRDNVFKRGSGVFLEPDTSDNSPIISPDDIQLQTVDSELFPEFYRKSAFTGPKETPKPFSIGQIEDIMKEDDTINLVVRRFYRPEDTKLGVMYEYDLNYLYWSDEVVDIDFNRVKGKCYLAFGDPSLTSTVDWSAKGPFRYYFKESYDPKKETFTSIPNDAIKSSIRKKQKGVGKGISNRSEIIQDVPPEWPQAKQPLRCMDVFAGCGGLSEGLRQAGIANLMWAIEKDEAAATSIKKNNPDATVYQTDCNELLRRAFLEQKRRKEDQELPAKRSVELLVGGPPCQGFSALNRYNAGQCSVAKNSMLMTFLGYCDFYRPNYIILENVRNLAVISKNMVLKLTLRCLLAIGYQVTFGVLQAGNYGVPQTRRRFFIMAAGPGSVLPLFPEPENVFSKKGCQLSIPVDNTKYYTGVRWTTSAPYRMITVRDAISDLPKIENGHTSIEISYDSPKTHFQRTLYFGDAEKTIENHICKHMVPLVLARISHIPLHAGADWRDLPNQVVILKDGTCTNKLLYTNRTNKQSKDDPPRGVCSCATGARCDPADRQNNTLIPWCLPHTADRHNHWAGLYGRLDWDGIFSTTITNPEPIGKQGRVLHPEQNRVVSVRECARSQGFSDEYMFNGSTLEKHRQIGNAVPPPLALALGRVLKEAVIATMTIKNENA